MKWSHDYHAKITQSLAQMEITGAMLDSEVLPGEGERPPEVVELEEKTLPLLERRIQTSANEVIKEEDVTMM